MHQISLASLSRRSSRVALLAPFLLLGGCLSYDESASLQPNGSGRIRVVYGFGAGTVDTAKATKLHQSIEESPGLHWKTTVDSTAENGRWFGGTIEFDSLASLSPLNDLLPLRGLFGDFSKTDSGNISILRRSVRLWPAEAQTTPMVWNLRWTLPGKVIFGDSLAKWQPGSNLVSWNLPTDGSSGKQADLEVRWTAGEESGQAGQAPWLPLAGAVLGLGGVVAALAAWRLRVSKARVERSATESV